MDNGPQIRVLRDIEELRKLLGIEKDDTGEPQVCSPELLDRRMRSVCMTTYQIVRGNDEATDGEQMNIGFYMRACIKGIESPRWKENSVSILLVETFILYLERKQKEDSRLFEREMIDCVDETYDYQVAEAEEHARKNRADTSSE